MSSASRETGSVFQFLRQVFRGFSLVTLCVIFIPLAIGAVVIGAFVFLPLPANLPTPKAALPSQPTHIYDVNGGEIATLSKFDKNIPVKQTDIPQVLKNALVSSEDHNFYKHKGVDPRGTMRALWADLRSNRTVQGGSTITQQYVKLAYVGKERTISRKLREAVLAGQLDRQMPKDEIMFNYLSVTYFGDGAYGVGAAAQTYFRKTVNDLTLSEAATLVGVIPAPSAYAPRENPIDAEARRKTVLNEMLQQKYITQQQYNDAVDQKLWSDTQGAPGGPATTIFSPEKTSTSFPYFVDYVTRYLKAKYGEDAVYRGGLRVQTTMDPAMQTAAEAAVSASLKGTSAPLEMALAAVEPPTGYVKALVGGRDFTKAQVNLALGGCPPRPKDAKGNLMKVQVEPTCWADKTTVSGGGTGRQPGSSFKSFVLAAAYEQGIPPTKTYPATATYSPPGCTGSNCVIGNFEGEVFGSMTLKEATAHSINTVFAPLIRDIGTKQTGHVIDGFIDTANVAKKLGVTSAYYSEGFHQTSGNYALGTIDVSPLDMAAAYSVFADRGLRASATPIVKIIDDTGKVIEDNTGRKPTRVLDETVADNVTDALEGVIDHGTGATNGHINRPAAGKTGTTEDSTNAWFVGYTPALSTSVWMGYSDRPRTINYKGNTNITGGTVPTQTWAAFMKQALKEVPPSEFSDPAPIKAPAADVLNVTGTTAPLPLAPQQIRQPVPTPSGNFDKTKINPPAVAPPSTTSTVPPFGTGGTGGGQGNGQVSKFGAPVSDDPQRRTAR